MEKPFDTTPASLDGFATHAIVDKREIVEQIKQLVGSLSPRGKFPGPNPCSLEKADLPKLKKGGNWLCEKTDGTRVLLVFLMHRGTKVALLVTRAWDVYVIGLRHVPKALFQGTVFDGELLTKQKIWLGFDAMIVAGVPVWSLPLSGRLTAARRSLGKYVHNPGDALQIQFKAYFRVFSEYTAYLKTTTHPTDGTVITPENSPVVLGRHQTLYKLKDSGKHTVDFEFADPDTLSVYCPTRGGSVPVGKLAPGFGRVTAGCIVEAAWAFGDTWSLVTIRSDKTTSNDMLTYTKTRINLRENLTLADLEPHWK